MIQPASDLPADHAFTCSTTGRLPTPPYPQNGAIPRPHRPTLPTPAANPPPGSPGDSGRATAGARRGLFEKKGP
jgi:hypothetical protein